jgi:hypothetical protein
LYFTTEFLRHDDSGTSPLGRGFDAAGFAMSADGKGMKSAVLLVARRR